MKITAISREDRNSVSTRIHYYSYLENLPEDISWEPHNGSFGDLIYIQKKADEKTIKIAKKAKKLGVPIVYDCDDNPYSKPGKDRVAMLKLADVVTCDTIPRGEQIKKAAGVGYTVIPETLDYFEQLKPMDVRWPVKSMVTFGNNSGSVNAVKYMKHSPVTCRHINSKNIDGAGKFVKWSYNTFIRDLCESEICILIHGDDRKSNLKLLVCMYIGLPTIVSNTTAFRDVYKKIGLEWLIAKSAGDVGGIVHKLMDTSNRIDVIKSYGQYDFSPHIPGAASMKLSKIFRSLV